MQALHLIKTLLPGWSSHRLGYMRCEAHKTCCPIHQFNTDGHFTDAASRRSVSSEYQVSDYPAAPRTEFRSKIRSFDSVPDVVVGEEAQNEIISPLTRMPNAISHLTHFCSGRLKRRTLPGIFIPLILASYFGSLTFAIWMFPDPFDWRTKSMSKLLYLKNNPQFHAIGSLGVAVAGLLTIPFAGYIGRRLRAVSPVPAAIGALAFGAGAISLILAALIVLQPFLHDTFARGAGICAGVGMLAFYWCAIRGFSGPPNERPARLRIFLAWSLIVPPALLVLVLRLLAAAHFQWSNPVYRAIEDRSLWHLGFWEWIGSIAGFLFLLAAALFLPEKE